MRCYIKNKETGEYYINGGLNRHNPNMTKDKDRAFIYWVNEWTTWGYEPEPLPSTPEKQGFEVGDRVVAYDAYSKKELEGKVGIYCGKSDEPNYPYKVNHDEYCGANYFGRIEHYKEESMPTHKTDTHVYTALKSLSPKSLLNDSPCNLEFNEYCKTFGFHNEPSLERVIEECKGHSAWLPWLKEHGYVRVEEVRKEKKSRTWSGIYWSMVDGVAVPGGPDTTALHDFAKRNIGKMKMTLEWEE